MHDKSQTLLSQKAETAIRSIYIRLIKSWNENNSEGFSSLFTDDGSIVGFDGSEVNGKREIQNHLSGIFADHRTARYVTIVREIRSLSDDVVLLRSVAGLVPPGQKRINPAMNAIQSLVSIKEADQFRIALFQNTPAAFHGRPEEAEQLTKELQARLQQIQSTNPSLTK